MSLTAAEIQQRRELVVAEARSWLGTPYHNAADIKHVGVDCGMLLVKVYVHTKECPPLDPRPYAPDWHLHQSGEFYLGFVNDHCREVAQPGLGDIMLFRWGRCYSHGAIISKLDPLTIIHAFQPWRKCVEIPVSQDPNLSKPGRNPRFFSFWAAGDS